MQKDISLKNFSSFKIGGLCQYFFTPTNLIELQEVLAWHEQKNIQPLIVGGLTNTLLPDEGLTSLIKISPQKGTHWQNQTLTCWAGNQTSLVAWESLQKNYQGLEAFTSLPGTIGGAIWNNAHYGTEYISDHLIAVEYYDYQKKTIKYQKKTKLNFAYDQSWFQKEKVIILSASWHLKKVTNNQTLKQKAIEIAHQRKTSQPLNLPSAGCFWQNVSNNENLKKLFPQFEKQNYLSAGFLIDQAGLKGIKVGQAQVSPQHASFIVNLGEAKANDVLNLARKIKQKVKQQFNISLQPEVVLIGADGNFINLN